MTIRLFGVDKKPSIFIDDSDIVKPDGYKFEALGWVRDGSESTSSKEKDFTSINNVTFSAMERDYVIRISSRRKLLYHNN